MILAVVSTAVLFTSSASAASEDTVKIYYQDVIGIQVDFPNGKAIKKGGELIIITSSDTYDMERSGIMFYECGPDGKPNRTTTVTPDHYSNSAGNTVTHIFRNLISDIEMDFTELKELGGQHVTPEEPKEDNKIVIEGHVYTTAVMLASVLLAVVMLAIMAMVIKDLDSVLNESDRIQ